MLSLLAAALVAVSAPTPTLTIPVLSAEQAAAAASLVGAIDLAQRTRRDDATHTALAKLKKEIKDLKDPIVAPPTLIAAAEHVGALVPDDEAVHLSVVTALLALTKDQPGPPQLKVRAWASTFVERNPTSVPGHDILATVLLQQGDEEGQLRALSACGVGCGARFTEALRVWQRVRCFDHALLSSLSLRMGHEELASSSDLAFIEPIPAIPAPVPVTPAPTRAPAGVTTAGTPARCLVQLQPTAAARVAARSAAVGAPTMFLLRGILLVSDTLEADPARGALFLPAAACASICKNPKPRPLPSGVVADVIAPTKTR